MNPRRRSFIRKICYALAILLLLFPLSWLGRPSTLDTPDAKGSPGGLLARQRKDAELDQVYLGKIDPTSETLKLATLGMRGIAANILWSKGIEYQKKKDWTNLSATLNQIIKLQPNFIDVWRHQGWNISYNCSAEFDDYHERYRWVIKGINFLKLGTTYNRREPRLDRDIGWFVSQKIGRSDEYKQFRRLFREDEDFNGALPLSERDNWLVGKSWFRKAENMIDNESASTKGMNPIVFRSEGPRCQMYYASSMEQDGIFGERARHAWQQATNDWDAFGQYEMPTTDGRFIRLGDYKRLLADLKKLIDKVDELAPGVRERLTKERYAQLTPEQREALEMPPNKRTSDQYALAVEAAALVRVTANEVARHRDVPRENLDAIKKLLDEIQTLEKRIKITDRYRGVVNYAYWGDRAKIEQEKDTLAARELGYQAEKALSEGDIRAAIRGFADASEKWANVMVKHPMLQTDIAIAGDLKDMLEKYGEALDQRNQLFPENFPLAGFIRAQIQDDPKIYRMRANLAKAAEAEADGNLSTAATLYAQVFHNWRQLINDMPSIEQRADPFTTHAILEIVRKYSDILKKLDQPIPADFPLHLFVRIQMEHDPLTLQAERAINKAEIERRQGDLSAAQKAYEQGFEIWHELLRKYPTLLGDNTIGEEWIVVIDEYRDLLKEQKEKMPKDFILQEVVDRYGRQ